MVKGPLDLSFLFNFTKELAPDFEHLVNQAFIPQPPEDLLGEDDIFDAVSKRISFSTIPMNLFSQ